MAAGLGLMCISTPFAVIAQVWPLEGLMPSSRLATHILETMSGRSGPNCALIAAALKCRSTRDIPEVPLGKLVREIWSGTKDWSARRYGFR